MKHQILKSLIFCVTVLCSITAIGQSKFEQAPDEHGKLTTDKNARQFINSFKVLPAIKATSLENTVNAIRDAIAKLPKANAPIGYDTRIFFSTSAYSLKGGTPNMDVNCYLRTLHKDTKTGVISASMDGADLYVKINDFGLFAQMGNYWAACSKLKLPLFFEAPPLTDSTNDFIEFNYKSDPVRIVTAGNRPLLVPLSRKEYLQFILVSRQDALKDIAETIKGKREGQQYLKGFMKTEKAEDTANTASAIKDIEYDIGEFQKRQRETEQELADCKTLLGTMTLQDAAAPARLNYDLKTNGSFGSISHLVPVGRREGVMLQKLNPEFYDRSSGAPTAQMMVLYYAWPKVGFAQDPNSVEQAAVDIFNQLDYHQLKESMK
jgi:hypothetical protein